MKILRTTTEVIEALGGTQAVADLTGRNYKAAAHWVRWEHFPPDTFVVMTAELAKRGQRAPEKLWRMVVPAAS